MTWHCPIYKEKCGLRISECRLGIRRFTFRNPQSAFRNRSTGVDLPAHRPRPSDELVPWPTERRRRDRPENRLGNRLSKHFDSAVRPDPIQTLSLFPAARVAAGDKSAASAKF